MWLSRPIWKRGWALEQLLRAQLILRKSSLFLKMSHLHKATDLSPEPLLPAFHWPTLDVTAGKLWSFCILTCEHALILENPSKKNTSAAPLGISSCSELHFFSLSTLFSKFFATFALERPVNTSTGAEMRHMAADSSCSAPVLESAFSFIFSRCLNRPAD